MPKRRHRERRHSEELIITSLVDIALCLVLGFMVSMPMIPNMMGVIIVAMTFAIPAAIFAEAFLSFIGIGIKSPQTSWGLLVSMGMKQIHTYPLRLFFPALLICLTMLSLQLIGDGLRDALDPKLRH